MKNILLQKETDPETANKIEDSLKTLQRLQSLVNSLLLIARIESHQYLREDNFAVQEMLKEIIGELNPVAEDKGVTMTREYVNDFILKEANRVACILNVLQCN